MMNQWITRMVSAIVLALAAGCVVIPTAAPAANPAPDPTEAAQENTSGAAAEGESYDDPFAYCAAVGTIDQPDERYTGPDVPDVIAEGLRTAFNTPDTPLEVYQRGTYWRCMDGKVYACNVGANLPCQEKADTSETPTAAMEEFCQDSANANAEAIPMVVTGRATIYGWRCTDGNPEIVNQFAEPDAQGFLSNIWYEIAPE
jgi:hypothetical protein